MERQLQKAAGFDYEKLILGYVAGATCSPDEVALSARDFANTAHAEIFDAAIRVAETGKLVDAVAIAEDLDRRGRLDHVGGAVYILQLVEAAPDAVHPANVADYARRITEDAERRRLKTSLLAAATQLDDPARSAAEIHESLDLQAASAGTSATRFEFLKSDELARGDFELSYLVRGLVVKGQPGIIAGPKKTLKTSLTAELGMALAAGGCVLGHEWFRVEAPCRVGIMSGESGAATIQETARRIAASKGRLLHSYQNLFWCFDIPKLGSLEDVRHIRQTIKRLNLDVLIIDPTYLALATDGGEGSIFAMGSLLSRVANIEAEAECSIVLVHHTKKAAEPISTKFQNWMTWRGQASRNSPDGGSC